MTVAGAVPGLALAAVAFAACAHARSTPRPPPAAAPVTGVGPAGLTLSTAPAGLLQSGAERMIQERLVALGQLTSDRVSGRLDDETEAALRRFQAAHGLAQTGLPSYETVDRLGLDANRIFRSGATPKPAPACGADGEMGAADEPPAPAP